MVAIMHGWMKWWEGPVRGLAQLAASILLSAYYFFVYTGGRDHKHPTMFEQFQTGNPHDLTVLIAFGMILMIGYSVAVVISDYRATGRFW